MDNEPQDQVMEEEEEDQVMEEEEEEEDEEEDELPQRATTLQEPIPPVMSQDDPRRMMLTCQERQWAIDIKNTIEMMPDVDNKSDFWYAQLALITQGDTMDAIRRMFALTDLFEEYSILDTFEEAEQAVREGPFHLIPRAYMPLPFCPEEGTYVFPVNPSKLDTSRVRRDPRLLQQFVKGLYYTYNLILPDLETIRKGPIVLWECQDVSWKAKHDFEFVAMVSEQLLKHYPIKPKGLKLCHVGVIFNLMFQWVRRVLPSTITNRVELVDMDVTLDEIYQVPNEEAARERLMAQAMELLQRRRRNEESFSLHHDIYSM